MEFKVGEILQSPILQHTETAKAASNTAASGLTLESIENTEPFIQMSKGSFTWQNVSI